jgi:serine/threonine protein kinase/tetratricopeptide (TPR) repeat protein
MNEPWWERVQQLVEGALEHPQEARRAFVASACGEDSKLRDEVLSLLEADGVDDLPSGWLSALASPEADRFAPGDLLAGRYRIRRLIGRGGMGEVYEADDDDLGITVALKTLREVGARGASLELLKLEGLLARAVWHPNVCRVYEVGRHGDDASPLCFLAMERLLGPTLQERLREKIRLPVADALRIAEEVGAGLGAAHQAGVVHGDLKPANIMLVFRDGAERAVVTDFGTGRAAPRSDRTAPTHRAGTIVGTPSYMAPEQLRGEEFGPAADIYALGVLLHEMVTGTVPFGDRSIDERIRLKLEDDVPSPREGMPGLDARWEAVIRRCLDRDPRLRFARAEDVAEALAGRAPVEAEGLAPRRSTLPSERDLFVGRDAELDDLERARNVGHRVMTLVGPGGMGKTRLAVHFAWRTADTWPGGVWFCDLTEARSADGVASAVGVSLGVQLGRGDAIRQLGHAIAGRGSCLLVLDNFEQVVAHVPETIGRWRSLAPDAVFLVTSRERLGLEGERTHAVESLAVEEALELFAHRARGLRPGLALEGADAEAAREVVRLLDGIPLAIELAAARVRVMSTPQILEGTRKRFRLLAGGGGARHETLEGTIDDSWELLAPWEQAAWAQCAVFEGGFTLEAASGVLDLDAWPDAPPIVDVVGSLVDKSLLRSWVPPPEPGETVPDVRFGMYVTLQEYARARLRTSAAVERTAETRHGAFHARLGSDEAIAAVDAHGGAPRRRRLYRELDNLIAACRRAIARGDGGTVASTYHAACRVLKARGPLGTSLALGQEALESGIQGADRAIVAVDLGETDWYAGRFEDARVHAESARVIAHGLADARLEARAAATVGRAAFVLGRADEAEACFEAALTLARSEGHRHLLATVLNALGMLHHELGRVEDARIDYEEALAITRAVGDRTLEAVTLLSLGILHHKRGHFDEAGAFFEAALAIHQDLGNRRSEGIARANLGSLKTDQGRIAEAREQAEAALAIAREMGSRVNEGNALVGLGEQYAETEDVDEARSCFESALAIVRELGDRRVEGIIVGNLARLDELGGETGEARARYETALAIHREVGDRHYEGSCLIGLGGLLVGSGLLAEARAALEAAEPILREIGARLELARLLCARAELEQSSGNAESARSALEEAEACAAELETRATSELGRALARARGAIPAPW